MPLIYMLFINFIQTISSSCAILIHFRAHAGIRRSWKRSIREVSGTDHYAQVVGRSNDCVEVPRSVDYEFPPASSSLMGDSPHKSAERPNACCDIWATGPGPGHTWALELALNYQVVQQDPIGLHV